MNVCLITCYIGRSRCIKRILRCFLNQNYEGNITLLLYNNGNVRNSLSEELNNIPQNRKIVLINNNKDLQTTKEYTNVGDIFRDALTFVPENTDVVNHFDSDDVFLPNHVSEGVKGMLIDRTKKVYKPHYSWYLHSEGIEKACNNMEPSCFIDFNYLKERGFKPLVAAYHDSWLLHSKENNLLTESLKIPSTFIYDWQGKAGVHKISGMGEERGNFENHRKYSSDNEFTILSPCEASEIEKIYNLIH